jgi:tRNA(Ile)-lysidine synthase
MSGKVKPTPIDAATFSRLIERFVPPLAPKIAVAVSGGPDSMALAFCLKRWTQRDVIALIVDHCLRAESECEAALVKTRLEHLGLHAEILKWDHTPVTGRLHEKARTARYRLLTDACRQHGVTDLLFAHHREDQAETILMRLAKGSGIDGLSGIASQRQHDTIRILRPFLTVSKRSLIATCTEANIATVTDPSNSSDKFARGRLRTIMPLLANEGMTVDNLIELGNRAAEANDALDFYATTLLNHASQTQLGGTVRLTRSALRDVPRATALRALCSCLRWVHPGDYPPERTAVASLLDAALSHTPIIRSLYGCLASLSENHLMLLREPSAATEITPLSKGECILWDRRWHITRTPFAASQPNEATIPTMIRALGNPPHDFLDQLAPDLRHRIPQGRVRATLPALWQRNTLCAIPSFAENSAFRLNYRKQSFP